MKDLSSEDLLKFCRTNLSTFFSPATEAFEGTRKLAGLDRQAGSTVRGTWNL
ncbi:hypothetical protein [Paraburkholderia sp. BR14374]|uniref:hypothetical protein n=1 Tax=Paraburkholderia sp. BR14374 TaxID=3237007 RepID=UPI0034CD7B84